MRLLAGILRTLILILAVLLGVVFALSNSVKVPLDLIVVSLPPTSLAFWVFMSFALGLALGVVIARTEHWLGLAWSRAKRALPGSGKSARATSAGKK